ncbi:MAG: VWA domain-containing protein [Acidobacteriota bacterium]|nr:VWA domain-containing protein [Acidobacteriota bacterium]
MRRAILGVTVGTLVFTVAQLRAAERHLAIIVDTSGSMEMADRQRYTVQLSQVLSDLTDDSDALSVIGMPDDLWLSLCSAGASQSLVLQLDPTNRAGFKQALDRAIQFDTGTYFAAPVRTAISLLPHDPKTRRMLLVIADSGGLGACEADLTRELQELKRDRVTIAAINIGSSSGAFDTNPAFDFTTAALDAQGLIAAVAQVYQRFLGAKQVQTGTVRGDVEVEIAPFVSEAFLVVAADGPIGALVEAGANPPKKSIDVNHRGGGSTLGLDGVLRGYRIVRIDQPAAGRWRFRAPGVAGNAGWMLLQDSSIGARLISPPNVAKGVAMPLELELFDQRTGQRIADTSKLPGLQVSAEIDGRSVAFRDHGQGGDRQARDGVLTATTTFANSGEQHLDVHLQSDFLDRRVAVSTRVIDAAWQLDIQSPKRAEVDRPVTLAVALRAIGPATALDAPSHIAVLTGGPAIELRDDGKGADRQAGDRVYSASWTPRDTGRLQLAYAAQGGSTTLEATAPLEVIGRVRFGAAVPIAFGRLKSESEADGLLDLRSADVRGAFDLQISTPFRSSRSALEIDMGKGWVELDATPRTLRLEERGPRTWRVRLRAGECPAAHPAGRRFEIVLAGTGANGRPIRTNIPVTAEIVADPWLHCWWPVLALAAGCFASGVVFHGYWSPSRFPERLGVVLSPEEDINEGFFHPIRGQRGTRSGFYRDARVYICQDFRLEGKARNALARLRADRQTVRIEAAPGASLWRQNGDGVWEQIPPGESNARYGDLYRNDHGTLFFQVRNA